MKIDDENLKEALSQMALMKGIAARSMTQLLAEHHAAFVDQGHVFVNQGEYTAQFAVILEGMVDITRAVPGGGVERLAALGPGQWFGEMSALSNQPALATVKASMASTLLLIDPPLFKELYRDKYDFKQLIDAEYRKRALVANLRSVPLFKGVAEQALLNLKDSAELIVVGEGKKPDVLGKKNDPADAIYLVRSGAIKKTTVGPDGKERILGYFNDNSSFGERAVLDDDTLRSWDGDYETMTRCDLVRVSREAIEEAFSFDPDLMRLLKTKALQITQEEDSGFAIGALELGDDVKPTDEALADRMRIMIDKESIKGGEALVIDLERCTRCNACVESCVAVHDDRVPRLSKKGNRISADKVLTSACYNCQVPSCMAKCNDGAIRRDSQGNIHFIFDNCTGCTACVLACPYDVIRMTPPPYEGPFMRKRTLLETLPFIGGVFTKLEEAKATKEREAARQENAIQAMTSAHTGKDVFGKAIKCDLCQGMPFEACIYNCPCNAISRRVPEDVVLTG